MDLGKELKERWQDCTSVILGVWLLISPFILGFNTENPVATLNAIIMGVGVMIFALAAVYRPYTWEEWVNLLLGVWLIASPFVLGFADLTAAMLNNVIIGALVGGDAVMAMLQHPPTKMAGGHSA